MNDSQRDNLLIRVDERVQSIQSTLERGALRMDKHDKRMDSHGKRIGVLERWRSAIAAGIAVIMFIVAVALRVM